VAHDEHDQLGELAGGLSEDGQAGAGVTADADADV